MEKEMPWRPLPREAPSGFEAVRRLVREGVAYWEGRMAQEPGATSGGRPDGGPAFPRVANLTTHDKGAAHTMRFSAECVGGMSLRDYFAGQALAGLMMNAAAIERISGGHYQRAGSRIAYEFADAMLAEREQETP